MTKEGDRAPPSAEVNSTEGEAGQRTREEVRDFIRELERETLKYSAR